MNTQVDREGFTWGSLAEAGVFTLVIAGAATMAFVIQGFDPALAIDLVVMLVGLALANRDRRSGAIVLLIGIIIFLVFGGFFATQVLIVPRSTIYFVLSAIYVVVGVATLIAAIGLLRTGRTPNPTARRIALGSIGIVLVLAAIAIGVRLTYDEPASDEGEAQVVAKDNEFIPEDLEGSGSNVTIVVDNEDLSLHTFSIEKLDVGFDLPGGVRTEVVVDGPPGTYEYFCEIFGHDDMKGTLTIE